MPDQPTLRKPLLPPNGASKVLLHSCCAPCSGEVMEALSSSGIAYTIYFYNPNINPREEYELRKQENIRFAEKVKVPFADADYDTDNWFARAKGLAWKAVVEFAPEASKQTLDLWPSPGGDFEIMRRVKALFDPSNLLNRGRLYRRI